MEIKKGDCRICIWGGKDVWEEAFYCHKFMLDEYDECENWEVDWANNMELRVAYKGW